MFGDETNSLNILYAAGLSTGQHQSENQLQNEQLCSTFSVIQINLLSMN